MARGSLGNANYEQLLAPGSLVTANYEQLLALGSLVIANYEQLLTPGSLVTANYEQLLASGSLVTANYEQLLASGSLVIANYEQLLASGSLVIANYEQLLTLGSLVIVNYEQLLASGSLVIANYEQLLTLGSLVIVNYEQLLALPSRLFSSVNRLFPPLSGFSARGASFFTLPIPMKGDWGDPFTVWDDFFWDAPDLPPTPPGRRKKTNRRTMASNPTPDSNDILRALSDQLADGCHQHEATLHILQNTEARIRADIATLLTAETQVGLKKAALDTAIAAHDVADAAGTEVLEKCKGVLRIRLGERWNPQWEPTGFPDQSTAVPRLKDARFALLAALKSYFTLVPASENAELGATAALCDAAWVVLSDARQVVANAESALTGSFTTRAVAADGLRSRVRGLINELDQLLAEDDPRWEDFGLNIPANPSSPTPVATVTVTPASNHRLEVAWSYATRATRFRVEGRIVGGAPEWENKGSFKDLEAILKGYTAGQVVELRVIAANDGGEAAPSPVVTATVG